MIGWRYNDNAFRLQVYTYNSMSPCLCVWHISVMKTGVNYCIYISIIYVGTVTFFMVPMKVL